MVRATLYLTLNLLLAATQTSGEPRRVSKADPVLSCHEQYPRPNSILLKAELVRLGKYSIQDNLSPNA